MLSTPPFYPITHRIQKTSIETIECGDPADKKTYSVKEQLFSRAAEWIEGSLCKTGSKNMNIQVLLRVFSPTYASDEKPRLSRCDRDRRDRTEHPRGRGKTVQTHQGSIGGLAGERGAGRPPRMSSSCLSALSRQSIATGYLFGRLNGRLGLIHQSHKWRQRMSSEDEKKLPGRIERIVAAATEGIVVLDIRKRYVFANAAAEKILGVSSEVILQRVFEQSEWRLKTVKGDPLDDDENPFTMVLRDHKSVYGMKVAIERPDGKGVIISVNASPLFDDAGNLEGMVGVLSDISEEFELQERNRAFHHTVAHDLRVPLTVVRGYAEMLQEVCVKSGRNGSMSTCVTGIVEATEKMERMLEDLVDDARLEGGTVHLALERIDFESYLWDLIEVSKKTIDETRIVTRIPQGLPPVSADPDRLERILLNLIGNALKFSPPESKVMIEVRESTDGDVMISISDRGKGLSDEDSARIFRRFFQADSTKKPGGIGLGLYISRLLVEAHGGRIWVESIVGKGSTFRFTLPLSTRAQ